MGQTVTKGILFFSSQCVSGVILDGLLQGWRYMS
jgi:hypothetical protein